MQASIIVSEHKFPLVRNDAGHAWANRLYVTLYNLSLNGIRKNDDPEESKAILQNIGSLLFEQNFKPTVQARLLRSVAAPRFIGYKLVAIMQDRPELDWTMITMGEPMPADHPKELYMHCIALIQLSITGAIVYGDNGQAVKADELKEGSKLCTQSAIVNSVQFLGPIQYASQMLDKMNRDKLELVSQFNQHFKYRIGYEVQEPAFGLAGIGCIQGIHFFATKNDAIRYLSIGFSGINLFSPCITEPHSSPQDERSQAEINMVNLRQSERLKIQKRRDAAMDAEMDAETTMRVGIEVGNAYYFAESMDEEKEIPSCCICMAPIWSKNPFMTRCGHVFHQTCLREWHIIQNKCPLCRKPLQEKFDNKRR